MMYFYGKLPIIQIPVIITHPKSVRFQQNVIEDILHSVLSVFVHMKINASQKKKVIQVWDDMTADCWYVWIVHRCICAKLPH